MNESRRVGRLAAIVAGAVTAFAAADDCFTSSYPGRQCCPNTRDIGCTDGENFWLCSASKTVAGGPWTPRAVTRVSASSPIGNRDQSFTLLGTCTYGANYSCGVSVGECIDSGPITITCGHTDPAGDSCTYSAQ